MNVTAIRPGQTSFSLGVNRAQFEKWGSYSDFVPADPCVQWSSLCDYRGIHRTLLEDTDGGAGMTGERFKLSRLEDGLTSQNYSK